MKSKQGKYCFWVTLSIIGPLLSAQDPIPFGQEVKALIKHNDSLWDPTKETMVFTGSSSIRFWGDLQGRFPQKQVLNTGFGGSQTSDLLIHLNDLVLRYRPNKVFIYEGDNDIFYGKRPSTIMGATKKIIAQLQKGDFSREIVLISAKPSLLRWEFRGKYKRLNKKMKKIAAKNAKVGFADIWSPMLHKGKVRADLFLKDGLHMNKKGYDIWYNTLKEFVD